MKTSNRARANKPSRKWLAIRTGTGQITGYIEGFLHEATMRYVTIPVAAG